MGNGFVRLKMASLSLVGGAGQVHSYLNAWVKVRNVAYTKDVRIHYRELGAWKDRSLAWKLNQGNCDLFALDPALDFGGNPFVEFAISFSANGATYWDNNNLANYSLTPSVTGLTGGNVALNIAELVYGGTAGSSYVTGIGGEILVNNLSYNKSVGIRHSDNGWQSYLDIPASFSRQVGEGGILEKWIFGRNTSPAAFGRGEFAVYYRNLDTGMDYWDANFGQNYDIRQRHQWE
ncbi:hypothetical protein ACQPZX_15985 [Actinoplanes sp. CA-142083]|uniref:hypothetical protein n=1 Tax=Actinoplanes sp. CA-142083 TaxID=3239903 RepID=UPI003D924E9B